MDLSSILDPTHLFTFLGGTAVGAAGKYYADKFTDQRKKHEKKVEERERFEQLRAQMPRLIAEMRQDLLENENEHLREFVVLPNENTFFNSDRQRLRYVESVHPAARNQADTIVAEGYADILQSEDPRIYRFRESFVRQVLSKA